MKILSVDSSAVSASCAVTDGGKVIASSFINTRLTHSQTLMPMIEDMLKSAGLTPSDIDFFAVNVGPGSFTGVRIGISSVKGMAFALNKPCIEISTLECIMMGARFPFGHYIIEAVMDARCNQVYNAAFEVENGEITRLCEDRAIKLDELKTELTEYTLPIVFAGDGADLCIDYFKNDFENILPADAANRYQHAKYTAIIAERLLNKNIGCTVDAGTLAVSYLRVPQAERELNKK